MAKKAKQWASLGLPEAPNEQAHTDWFQRVLALMDERTTSTAPMLAAEYNDLEDELAIIDTRRSELTALREALDRLVLRFIDANKIDKLSLDGQTFSERIDLQAHVENRETFKAWIHETQQDELLQVNAGHVKTIVKDALDPEVVLSLTPGERAKLKPGSPGSGACPPGVVASTRRTLGRVRTKR